MNDIPNRFPASLIDRYCDYLTPVCEMMIQLEMEFDKALDAKRLAKAVELTLDAEPILGCRFVDDSYKPYFEKLAPDQRSAFFPVTSRNEYEAFKSRAIDHKKGPQINVCLWQSNDGDRLMLKVAHHVADAGGVKDTAAILSGIYRTLSKNPDYRPSPNVKEQRSFRQIIKHVPLHAYPRIYLNFIQNLLRLYKPHTVHIVSTTDGQRAPLTYVTRTISSDRRSRLTQYGRSHNATLNDIITAAALRALAGMGNWSGGSHLNLSTTIDMRRYIPSGHAEAVANLSDTLIQWPDLGTEPGRDFAATLEKVAKITRYGKTHWIGLALMFDPLNLPTKVMPHARMVKYYSDFANLGLRKQNVGQSFTNTGPIAPESINFDTPPATACILPPQVYPWWPLIFSLSGYNGTLTLAAGAYPTQKETIEKFFDAILKELPV